ncbi:protein of unknown function DUF201 [Acidimicrobium ferrooxidans DSM 10331]|uniref:ATP-grasp domain-containing protein n=1 Tax=Acidimicrobium ferrooxidans (strain DSM 10331 / JCM 15462 / NBRC 103882 / ICP) TaxID=525909 RepID=C7M0Y2_ACIFD|nr:ATP-grasp domain-containing protein [Acidimicrobium ferrooxidans]ACU54640.1 protein of unknown function DUF201 [Acidimicrobium ferrooxidans DSM 10331]
MARLALVVPAHSYRGNDFLAAATPHQLTIVTDAEEPLGGDHIVRSSLSLDASETDRLAQVLVERSVEAVIGVDEYSVQLAADVSDRMGLSHGRGEAIRRATHKDQLRSTLDRAELPQPSWHVADSVAAIDVDWLERALGPGPWVLKPLDRTASEGVVRVDASTLAWGRDQLAAVVGSHAPVLAETFVPGAEIAVEAILTDGALEIVTVFDKPDIGDGPTFWEATYLAPSSIPLSVIEEVRVLIERAARALDLHTTPIHAELRLPEGRPVIIELAPRTIGGRCARAIRLDDGRHLEDLVIERALNQPRTIPAARRGGPIGIWMLPTPHDGTFEGLDGVEVAAAIPGVERIEMTTTAGTTVYAPPRTRSYLGFVFVSGRSRRRVLSTLDQVRSVLRPRVAPAS